MLSFLLIQFNLVYGLFGQSNMHSTFDFCPRPAKKEANVPLHKLIAYCPNIYTVLLGLAAAAGADYTGQLHVGRSGGWAGNQHSPWLGKNNWDPR